MQIHAGRCEVAPEVSAARVCTSMSTHLHAVDNLLTCMHLITKLAIHITIHILSDQFSTSLQHLAKAPCDCFLPKLCHALSSAGFTYSIFLHISEKTFKNGSPISWSMESCGECN